MILLLLLEIFLKECIQLFKWNEAHLVIEIGMAGTGDDAQLLIVTGELFIDTLAEITGVCLLAIPAPTAHALCTMR